MPAAPQKEGYPTALHGSHHLQRQAPSRIFQLHPTHIGSAGRIMAKLMQTMGCALHSKGSWCMLQAEPLKHSRQMCSPSFLANMSMVARKQELSAYSPRPSAVLSFFFLGIASSLAAMSCHPAVNVSASRDTHSGQLLGWKAANHTAKIFECLRAQSAHLNVQRMLRISICKAIGMAILESTAPVLYLLQQSHPACNFPVSGMGEVFNLVGNPSCSQRDLSLCTETNSG